MDHIYIPICAGRYIWSDSEKSVQLLNITSYRYSYFNIHCTSTNNNHQEERNPGVHSKAAQCGGRRASAPVAAGAANTKRGLQEEAREIADLADTGSEMESSSAEDPEVASGSNRPVTPNSNAIRSIGMYHTILQWRNMYII